MDAETRSTETPETEAVGKIRLDDVGELSADELAERLSGGTLEVIVNSALSEWGSLVEELFHKLERGVNDWHSTEANRTVIINFVEES